MPVTLNRGVATGGIWVFIPPKSAQVNLWGKNDVRTAIQQFYTPKNFYTPKKQISDYTPDAELNTQLLINQIHRRWPKKRDHSTFSQYN